MKTRPEYVEKDKVATWLAVAWGAQLFGSSLVLYTYDEVPKKIISSSLQYLIIAMLCLTFIAVAIYIAWLVFQSIGATGFPAPNAKSPAKYKISYDSTAIAVRIISLLAALSLFGIAFMWGSLLY